MSEPGIEYAIVLGCDALRARVTLNGATVVGAWQNRPHTARSRLIPWLLAGDNRLAVEVGLAVAERAPGVADGEPRLRLDLHRLLRGAQPAAYNRMVSFQLTLNEHVLDGDEMTPVFAHRFRAATAPPRWMWLDAVPYDAERDESDLLDAFARLHAALEAADTGVVQGMLAARRSELCEALGMPADETELAEHAFLESYFEHDDWAMDPLDRAAVQARSEAGGLLVRLAGPDGGAPLTGRGGGRPFALDLTYAHVDGAWVAVR